MGKILKLLNWIRHAFKGNPGDWMDNNDSAVLDGQAIKPSSKTAPFYDYKPDEEYEALAKPVMNPVLAFHEALLCDDPGKLSDDNPFKGRKVAVEEAFVYESMVNDRGAQMTNKSMLDKRGKIVPFRIRQIEGKDYTALVKESKHLLETMPEYVKQLKESKAQTFKSLKAAGLIEDVDFAQDQTYNTTPYDMAQYTEYTPLYGGPFNKQLYLTDYLTMHSRSYEQKNHHPLAKRIIDVLAQYAFGRRFKVRWNDPDKENNWEKFNAQYNIVHRCSEFWVREYLTYGELMLNKLNWQSIDPSTVWDIITDPDDITDVYYYYQSYSTAYQTFTGFKIAGMPGSQNQEPVKFIIRQIPAHQVMHIKGNVVSQEKRGRSILFPILGWLKRIKDLYDAEIIRAQLQACFLWDDTIKGNASDVAAHIANYSSMPTKATFFAHNEAIERKAMAAMPNAERGTGPGEEVLAFIATAIGIPKDFFNLIAGGSGGGRATALVGAEPFEKVIEDLQAKFERLLLEIAEEITEQSGLQWNEGDCEFIFPSVTKDTTSETIANISMGQEMGWVDDKTSGEMFATEMNITGYDYETMKERIKEFKAANPDPLMPNPSRFSNPQNPAAPPTDGSVPNDVSPIHGTGKKNLKGQMNKI